MNCPKCGAQMMPGASFCGALWHRIDAQATPPAVGCANYGAAQGIHIDADSRGQGRGY